MTAPLWIGLGLYLVLIVGVVALVDPLPLARMARRALVRWCRIVIVYEDCARCDGLGMILHEGCWLCRTCAEEQGVPLAWERDDR